MTSNFNTQRSVSSDLQTPYGSQRFDSFGHFRGLRSSLWSLCGKNNLASVKDQKADFKLGDRGSVRPIRISQGIRVPLREGFCSKTLFQDVGRPCFLGFPRMEDVSCRGVICGTSGQLPVFLNHAKDCKWGSAEPVPSIQYKSPCDGNAELSASQNDDTLQASSVTRAGVPMRQRTAADFDQLKQTSDPSYYIPEELSATLGWLSLGLCGNALMMRVGFDGRCFHHQGSACTLANLGERITCSNMPYAPADTKAFGWSCSGLKGSVSKVTGQERLPLLQGKPFTTKKIENFRENQNKHKKVGKTATLTRDLYERSSFHLFEVLFCYPLLNHNEGALNFQIPRKSLTELVSILKQAAVGLAGVSATWLLFVASRILWLDVSPNKHSISSLVMGLGFLLLSWAMKRVSDVLLCLADAYGGSRLSQQEYLTGLQKELQCIALGAIVLVVICFMGGG